jgi:hypothetical protein
MKRLVLVLIVLLAIFSVIRAYTQGRGARGPGVALGPGLIEVSGGTGTLSIAFGLLESGAGGAGNLLPLRIVYSDGSTNLAIGLNGFSFLLGSGASVGRPVQVDSPRTGDVVSIGGAVTVNSRVTGDVWAFGADVALLAGANVGGNVVAIGGRVRADPRARVAGAVSALPGLRLPFLGAMAGSSVAAAELGREVLLFLLSGLVLFLAAFFLTPQLSGIAASSRRRWRQALLTAALGLVVVPAVVLLLIVSVLGIFFVPFLILGVLVAAFGGYLALAARLGAGLRRSSAQSSVFLFSSGVLGLFVLKAPALAGIILDLVKSSVAGTVGQVLRMVSLVATAAFLVFGFGAVLAHVRAVAAGKAG